MSESLEDVLLSLVDALETGDVEYALVGGVAVLAWGDPRTTRDIDVIARLQADELPRLAESLAPHGLTFDADGAARALKERSHFTIFHEEAFYHVDVLPAHASSHLQTLRGRRRVDVGDTACWIASPEDTIANKLLFGSEQDIQDAAGICARLHDELDEERLTARCAALGVQEDLDELRQRVDRALESE